MESVKIKRLINHNRIQSTAHLLLETLLQTEKVQTLLINAALHLVATAGGITRTGNDQFVAQTAVVGVLQ